MKQLGYLNAHITGDFRYTDRLSVELDENNGRVYISVFSTSPIGGMDGPGGAHGYELKERVHVDPVPAEIMKAVKQFIRKSQYCFLVWGKPTKRFVWNTESGEKQGLSLALVREALDAVL